MTVWDEKLSKDLQKSLLSELIRLKIDAQTRMHKELHEDVKKKMSGQISAFERVIELIENWNHTHRNKS
jgi:hypothetical protein